MRGDESMSAAKDRLLRPETIQHRDEMRRGRADTLRAPPAWTGSIFGLVVLLVLSGGLLLVFGRVGRIAEGPAVVWVERTIVTAPSSGVVANVHVCRGQLVAADEPLVGFTDVTERAELQRLDAAFDVQLIDRLREPHAAVPRQALAQLRPARAAAAALLARCTVRAPHAGVVADLQVRPSEFLSAGEPLLALTPNSPPHAAPAVLAWLPAVHLPQLKVGTKLNFEPLGYRHQSVSAVIEQVSAAAVGPQMARRRLGAALADTVPLAGPLVQVRARLSSTHLPVDDREYTLSHGMAGTAIVSLYTEPLMFRLFPWLRKVALGSQP